MKTLTLTDYQLETIQHACEVMDRIMGGQLHIALEEAYSSFPDGNLKWLSIDEQIRIKESFIENCIKDDSPVKNKGVHSWTGNTRAFCAREIKQTIRQHFAYERKPDGGFQNHFDDPLMISGEPKPEIKTL